MFKTIKLDNTGGLYTYQETLDWLQTAYSQLLDAIAGSYGDKVIISGLTIAGGTVSSGWVVINGELLPFVSGAVADYAYVETATTNEQYDDTSTKPTYFIKRVKLATVPTGSTFPFSDLVRLPFTTGSAATLKDALATIQNTFKSIVNLEPCVILSGCVVSSVNTGTSKCSISAGTVMINGAMVSAPARVNDTYPCYLKADGTYVNAQPVSGDYVTFDPYTSQYYPDVVKRAMHKTGSIVMTSSAADKAMFDDATGLGKWAWKGWKICDLLQSRVPVGYDRRSSDPEDGIYDASYRTVGYQDSAHTNAKSIQKTNLPAVNILGNANQTTVTAGGAGMVKVSNSGENVTVNSFDSGGSGSEMNARDVFPFPNLGNGTPLDTRQSFAVILFAERI